MIKGQPFRMNVVVIKNEDEVLRVRCHDVYQTTLAENHHKGLITKRIRRTLIQSPSCRPNGDSCAKIQQNIETNNNNDIKKENIRMNKKQIRLTESDLKQIVKESVNKILNEAYGTLPRNDWHFTTTLNNGDYPEDSIYGTIKGKARNLLRLVKDANYPPNNSMKIYLDKIQKDLEHIIKIVQPLKKMEIMQRGVNPDSVRGGREYNDGNEGFSDYSGGSFY